MPFNIYGPQTSYGGYPLLSSGEIGLTFAGLTVAPLMVKETLAEMLFSMQAIPGMHDYGMDGIADIMFRVYSLVSDDICGSIGAAGCTCVLFAGYCTTQHRLRAFRMEIDQKSSLSCKEVLINEGEVEVFGSGEIAAKAKMPGTARERELLGVLQDVIDDAKVPSVGGNPQFGSFYGQKFQPAGVAKLDGNNVHYWRGMLDLNAPTFTQSTKLIPNFRLLNLIKTP
jgi:hypothetical protein